MKIIESIKKNKLCIISFAVIAVVFICYGIIKSDFFLDETYNFRMANGDMTNAAFAGTTDSSLEDSVIDRVITHDEFENLVSATDNKFDYSGVYENSVGDVHPPLYPFILHTVFSIIGGGYSFAKYKAIALALNFVFYALTLFLLYKICKRLFGSDKIAVLTMILYGLSAMGLSNAVYIRMYLLITLLGVLLMYLIVVLLQTGKRFLYPLITLVIFVGFYSDYYFAIFAGILCAGACVYLLVKKQYKKLICFSLFALAGVALMILVFPEVLYDVFGRTGELSGQAAVENIVLTKNSGKKIMKLILFLGIAVFCMLIAVAVGIAAVILIIKNRKLKEVWNIIKKDANVHIALVLIIPAFIALIISALISPYIVARYVFNICPAIILTVSLAIYLLNKTSIKKPLLLSNRFAFAMMALSIAALFVIQPRYLYPEYREYNKIIDNYTDEPCVYYLERDCNPQIGSDLPQLIKFDDIFATDNLDSVGLRDYLKSKGDPDNIIFYFGTYTTRHAAQNDSVRVDEEYGDEQVEKKLEEVLDEVAEKTEYKSYEKLFDGGSSATYRLSKQPITSEE